MQDRCARQPADRLRPFEVGYRHGALRSAPKRRKTDASPLASRRAKRRNTITRWLEEALAVFLGECRGPQVVVGSSMGGWIALLLLRELRRRTEGAAASVAALVLIAPAVDFTEVLMWQRFPAKVKKEIETKGVWLRPSDYGELYPITRALIEDGRNHLLLGS